MTNRERFILLNLIPDIASLRVRRLLEHFGGLEPLWRAGAEEIQRVHGIGPHLARRVAAACRDERPLEEELALARRHGVRVVTLEDAEYPPLLRTIYDPPVALYVQGRVPAPEDVTLALVGSRRASPYGLVVAQRLAAELVARGVTVVSGLARGIDAAAHRGALQARGRTIGVLGGGFTRFYPPEHQALAWEMAHAGGAILSEYPMRMSPLAQNFPRRNRLISGLSQGVVVVEAAARSGALVTCDLALEQGRSVFAIPGQITAVTASGTNRLIREGAVPVTCAQDIVDELGLTAAVCEPHATPHARPTTSTSQCPSPLQPDGRSDPAVASRPLAVGGQVVEQRTGGQDVAPIGENVPVPRALPAGLQEEGLTEHEHIVLAQLDDREPTSLEAVTASSGLPASACAAALLTLELKRFVKPLPGTRFVRR